MRGADLNDVLWADIADRRRFEAANAGQLAGLTVQSATEAWMVGPTGAEWRPVGEPAPDGVTDAELEIPMWRLPPRTEDCTAAQTRSLWFGLVPTYSSDMDRAGIPRLDDRGIYEIYCFARRKPAPGHEHCPPQIWWSAASEPFRLAAVFDPEGTKNHKVSIKLPDFRTLAARAGRPPGPGGVAVTSPPGSQMQFNPFDGVPKPGSGSLVGEAERICIFAFELFIIVGFFVFLLFLPIVVFVFQLWWMLALRFCLPPLVEAFALLEAHFSAGTLGTLPDFDPNDPDRADKRKVEEIFGSVGMTQALDAVKVKVNNVDVPLFDGDTMKDMLDAVDPRAADTPEPPDLEPRPDDPLCPKPAGP
jgi:hypothetical protein